MLSTSHSHVHTLNFHNVIDHNSISINKKLIKQNVYHRAHTGCRSEGIKSIQILRSVVSPKMLQVLRGKGWRNIHTPFMPLLSLLLSDIL